MSYLEDAELASMRADAAEALDGTAIIQTQTRVSDVLGGHTTTWIPSGTVNCRLAPYLRGREEVQGERLSPDTESIFTFPALTPIDHNCQVVYGGGTFSVVDVKARSIEITRRVTVKGIE